MDLDSSSMTMTGFVLHMVDVIFFIYPNLSVFADLDRLCSTRRSAGLPHLVASICVTEPSTGNALATALGHLLALEHKTEAYR